MLKRAILLVITLLVIILAMQAPMVAEAAANDSSQTRVIALRIGSPYISINGVSQQIDEEGTAPYIENGRTLVPFRAIFDALSLDVDWNDGEITGTHGNTIIKLTIGSRIAYRNGNSIYLDIPPVIRNGRVMVPLRFIAESISAEVNWNQTTQTITIRQTPLFVELAGVRINIGDTIRSVQNVLGAPNRVDLNYYDFDWHVYNSDYRRFIMVGIKNGLVEAIYTNSWGFVTNKAKYGDKRNSAAATQGITLYYDSVNNGVAHAVMIMSPDVGLRDSHNKDSLHRSQELQIFDMTNAFRVCYGRPTLEWDSIAALTARKHSQDMQNRGFFGHISPDGKGPDARYRANNGRNSYSGESIALGFGSSYGVHDGWVNSSGHRDNMLDQSHRYLGVGISNDGIHITQLFCR